MIIQPHVYFIPLNNQLSRIQFEQGLALSWLTEDEINKVHRYKAEQAQHNALQVRLALRAVLSMHSDVLPHQWLFEYGDKGKPSLSAELFEQTGLHFNLSHSGDWLMIGVLLCAEASSGISSGDSERRHYGVFKAILFGLDIERVRASTHIQPILNHYFTDNEVADLVALPDALQRQRFFDLWTLKEAFIKATGKGLAQSLSSFSFSFNDNKVFQADCFSVSKNAPAVAFESAVVKAAERAPSPILCRHDDVHFTAPVTDNSQWTCRFGRLTDSYRFSFCIGTDAVLSGSNENGSDDLAGGVKITEPIMVLTSLAQLLS
ncbi:4'-phosphopantetheinyl transferase family protein [Shewanella glacialimarina]|uniref:4'-phosphopantetheinyl transferase family protein n=1 Tax=Shewanella glacialimarina TaxID=2590884 RepID=UPI001CF8716D|nr:4'-phosphopantetheinyl transferase superfamily protein [Shewanella glacialimarina]UCX04282.1 4'-phosphopantetheinyl transferase superfamily protein [Shewanella glacialimarina]